MPIQIQLQWDKIESWLKLHAPATFEGLNPPATEQQIAEAEAALGIRFPAAVVESFRIHNGQSSESPWLFNGWEFLSLERIVDEWGVWKGLLDGGDFEGCTSEVSDYTVQDWWSPLWIPLTYDACGNHDCLDLNPGVKGQSGQIIKMWHDGEERPLEAESYAAWLEQFASDMEAGRYQMSEEYGAIMLTDDI